MTTTYFINIALPKCSVEPIAQQGNPIEILNEFGGMDNFKKAIEELQTLLYTEAA